MVPVYCVGETLEQFEKGLTKEIVGEQVRVGLASLCPNCAKRIIIAYEPVLVREKMLLQKLLKTFVTSFVKQLKKCIQVQKKTL